ncbi:MAG TPA: porphobilinogen synthase [Gammaproteobacteria bacterium]|nr:porphobilinogen synthase [Gammaproteobacteria bacterium]
MHTSSRFPTTRLRRLRYSAKLRDLVRETHLSVNDIILPLFVKAGSGIRQPIASMPGHFQLSCDLLVDEIKTIKALGIPGVILFGIPAFKDATGSSANQADGVIQQAIKIIKDCAPDLLVITDLCFCEYTDHGHCGVMKQHSGLWDVDNDATLELLAAQAVSHARAGADIIAPSGMMDGMVAAIRQGLDTEGYPELPILSYSAKYCSAFYGPFRAAAESAPQSGNRRSYQMDPANGGQALREVALDLTEGADLVMVKPAGAYLDIIYRVSQAFPGVPLGAYQVSGEFAMIKAAAANGWVDEQQAALESLIAIKRAGARFILSYFAKQVAQWLGGE